MLLPPSKVIDFFPDYRTTQTPWQGLTPVAAWLVCDLRPARIVELGSYRGDSFFAFLQAAEGDDQVTDLVAIDSWNGDQHTGPYGDAVLEQFMTELTHRADPRARHIRSFFAEAVAKFQDSSIDLLHIDGAHDYASVRADYETWLPKMADNGVIIFHDTMVRGDDFGVWQFWEELENAHPGRTFNFRHSNGLGILCCGESRQGQIRQLGTLGASEAGMLREVMEAAGREVVELTRQEFQLIIRNGVDMPMTHVFARGDARETLLRLVRRNAFGAVQDEHSQQAVRGIAQQAIDARISTLLAEQAHDVMAALQPLIDQNLASLQAGLLDQLDRKVEQAIADGRAQLDARIEHLVPHQAGDLFTALRPFLQEDAASMQAELQDRLDRKVEHVLDDGRAQIDARIERLVRDQASDLFEALRPLFEQYFTQSLTNTVRQLTRDKNDAQDDAIIGIGAKVDAQEAALQELAGYVRQVFQHPLFMPRKTG